MNKEKLKRTLIDLGKDIMVAFVIVCVVMLALFAYCGIWPPMVVVESGSMQRYDDRSAIGIIDTGDMVFVKKVNGIDDVVTYVEGEMTGHSKYGTYGDVIIYRPNGNLTATPIIHRAVVWLEVNATMCRNQSASDFDYDNCTFDVPSLGRYGATGIIALPEYGFWKDAATINLDGLLIYYRNKNMVPHGGYITMGDNNAPFYDQPLSGSYEPVLPEWIVGKAIGEIPWFGLIKLKATGTLLHNVPGNSWTGLYITIFLLLFVPFMVDILTPRIVKWRKKNRKQDDKAEDMAEPGAAPSEEYGKTLEPHPEPSERVPTEQDAPIPENTEK